MARLAEVPLLHQPGHGWSYDSGCDVLGVLLRRATESSLGEVLADMVFEPLGMRGTTFGTTDAERMTSLYERGDDGFEEVDPPDGQWTSAPPSESGAGGVCPASTTGGRSGGCCSRAGRTCSRRSRCG